MVAISIHAPPRGATDLVARGLMNPDGFQFTPLREGRRDMPPFAAVPEVFQFTPLREGRRPHKVHIRRFPISIHAPPRGATALQDTYISIDAISIHAPPRGATIMQSVNIYPMIDFNSRPSARGDPAFIFLGGRMNISIHAPPRGATGCDRAGHCRAHFNSRPSARGDGKRYAISANLLFNPYKSAWLNNSATQFVEIILVIFHRIIA